jgi:uncharacterized protein
MLDIDEMSSVEIYDLLREVGYGHLGFIHEGKPCVMPMHYYLEDQDIYLFTTEGMKTHDIDVMGQAQRLTKQVNIDRAMGIIKAQNPTLSPAVNRTWVDSWGRAEIIAIYRIFPGEMSGRTTDGVSSRVAVGV